MDEHVRVNEKLLEQAVSLSGEDNAEKVVELALEEFVRRRRKLQALMDIAGKIEFYEDYDHKVIRKTRYDAP